MIAYDIIETTFYQGISKNRNLLEVPVSLPAYGKVLQEATMMVWECKICGYVYNQEKGDPNGNIAPGTPFEDIPEDWKCPLCNSAKDYSFVEKDESEATPQG